MAIKIKIPNSRRTKGSTGGRDPVIRVAVAAFILCSTVFFAVFSYYYVRYDRIIDRRMSGQIFNTSAQIYARPQVVQVGDHITPENIATLLRRAGYVEQGKAPDSSMGFFQMLPNGIEIQPGPESFHGPDGAIIRDTPQGTVQSIVAAGSNGAALEGYALEPELVTALSEGQRRTKRQLVTFADLPKVLVNAVTAIEDRRFFTHSGINYYRFVEAALYDLREGRKGQGASTITMQVSRAFFLSPQKTIRRKAIEMLIAIQLEQKFSKEQIFELYANQVPMGQRGSFAVTGFGEAARAYFNKDVKNLTLPEAALLAGLIQRPSYLSPYRHPDRALDRRNLVIDAMVDTGAISRDEAEKAKAAPLNLAPLNVEASDAPYFVDLVKDALSKQYSESDLNENAYRIYTTLDPQLQEAAAQAVDIGMKNVDAQVQRQRLRRRKVGTGRNAKYENVELPGPTPQVALVAIDPHTGEVLALVGGRNYGFSQLDHAIAQRPTGSIFKPFVYATGIDSGIDPDTPPGQAITPVSYLTDEPTVFTFDNGKTYEPHNYKNEYHGQVTAAYALKESLNNATVSFAQMVGLDKVAALARAAGITSVQPTPAMALGSYDASPLEMAGAYTVFANQGVRLSPMMIESVRTAQGDVVVNFHNTATPVLDPRVAYVMTRMMQGVINSGTGYAVRQRGFMLPAAGKTGTSHDGWFAGYTSNLLCIVWVGYDDYSDLNLPGATTAAPIWAEFMKRATALPQYHDATDFPQPPGVVDVELDKTTNLLATAACPEDYDMAFIAGTEPTATCDGAQQPRGFFQKLFSIGRSPQPPAQQPPQPTPSGQYPVRIPVPEPQAQQQPPPAQPVEKKSFWGKFFGSFKGDDNSKKDQQKGNNPPPK